MILPSTKIHVTQKLIPRQLQVLVDDKIKLFKSQDLVNASYEEQVGVLTGYKFINTDLNCGGYCDRKNKIIALGPYGGKFWDRSTILHEVGHALQAEAEVFERGDYKLATTVLKMEWQVEGIAYRFYNAVYNEKMPHHKFHAYFKEADVEFLKSWRGKWMEDDTIELNKISNRL